MAPAGNSKKLVLVAMIFAVAMTFIDQTIVAIAVPELQKDLSLSTTGVQWVINGYLLALSALFAFGGRLADLAGHRRMVLIGVVVFAASSAMCGATPTGSAAEAWLIVFRVIQGAGAALMFPAALAIVVSAFPLRERGRAMAIFFGVTGGLTAVGPMAGGYLTAIDWRAIFWINIPVAIIAVVLTLLSKPAEDRQPAKLDVRGAIIISAGMALAVLGLQQSSVWGWGDPLTWLCIAAGLVLLAVFVVYERGVDEPLIRVSIFRDRGFAVDNVVLFLMSAVFIPLFFFGSLYAQIGLEQSASEAGLYLLIFFAGFATAAQIGGRILDQRGARVAMVPGCLIAAVGLALWGWRLPDLDLDNQWYFIVLAGFGIGLLLGPASTDAVNRAPRHQLRRGDRRDPDQPELRGQPRAGGARHHSGPAREGQHRVVAGRARRAEGAGGPDRRCPQPRRGRIGLRRASRQPSRDAAGDRAGRLRPRRSRRSSTSWRA